MINNRHILTVVVLVLLMVPFPASGAEPFFAFPPSPGASSGLPSPEDVGIHMDMKGILNEIWTLEGYTDDGEVVRAALGFSEGIPWGSNPFVTASFLETDGTLYQTNIRGKREEFTASRAGLNLVLGGNYFREKKDADGTARYSLKIHEQGFSLSLDLTCLSPGWNPPGDGQILFGKDREIFWDLSVTCPRLRFEGNVRTEKIDKPIRGWAYSDHTYTNARIIAFSKKWTSFRSHHPDLSINFFEMITPERFGKRPVRLLVLADANRAYHFPEIKVIEEDVREDGETGYRYPGIMNISASDGPDRVEVRLELKAVLNRANSVDTLNWAQAAVVRILGFKPVGYTFSHEGFVRVTRQGKTREYPATQFHSMLVLDE